MGTLLCAQANDSNHIFHALKNTPSGLIPNQKVEAAAKVYTLLFRITRTNKMAEFPTFDCFHVLADYMEE